jgi:hypothetical protein
VETVVSSAVSTGSTGELSAEGPRRGRRDTEAHGIPLAASLTGGNRNDITQLLH